MSPFSGLFVVEASRDEREGCEVKPKKLSSFAHFARHWLVVVTVQSGEIEKHSPATAARTATTAGQRAANGEPSAVKAGRPAMILEHSATTAARSKMTAEQFAATGGQWRKTMETPELQEKA